MRIIQEALTFDDVLLAPAYSEVLPREVSLATAAARGIELNIPVMSAAMDTVTESALAIALAKEGGLGVIHKNMTPELQARHVAAVKKYASGVVSDPITVNPEESVREVLEITRRNNISGLP
ncbi:MAG: IMP dehydrogenase, partial [Chromatiales bacterium]|nr:IMP dehydrogenase [Chromatiales bacterium]